MIDTILNSQHASNRPQQQTRDSFDFLTQKPEIVLHTYNC